MRIKKECWPRIATAFIHDGDQGLACRANRRWRISVRQHADGRCIVYGSYNSSWQHEADLDAGYLLDASEATNEGLVRAIRRVGGVIECSDVLVQQAIAALPAEDVDDEPADPAAEHAAAETVAALLRLQQRVESGQLSLADALMAAHTLHR